MRALLTGLLLTAALPLGGCFSHPRDIEMSRIEPQPTCTVGDCVRDEIRACASMEARSNGRCDAHTAPVPTAVTRDDVRRQEKALRKAAR